jgi:hypothetical protein
VVPHTRSYASRSIARKRQRTTSFPNRQNDASCLVSLEQVDHPNKNRGRRYHKAAAINVPAQKSIQTSRWATHIIHDTIATEAGLFHLGSSDQEKNQRCSAYMLNAPTDDALSIIELSFRVIDGAVRARYDYLPAECRVTQHPDKAIEELNHRFKEHAIGYQYVDGILMRIDLQFLHAEIVKPALAASDPTAIVKMTIAPKQCGRQFRNKANVGVSLFPTL